MRTQESMNETGQVHRLSENLMTHLAKGKEWATPGVQAALQRAVGGLDAGIDTASPRLQALLRGLADELAGGVETLTPRVQERLKHLAPQGAAEVVDHVPAKDGGPTSRKWLWIGAVLAATVAGAAAWRSSRASAEEPAPLAPAQDATGVDLTADPDLTPGRM